MLARRYGVLPTVIVREDADFLLRHVSILTEAGVIKDDSGG